MLKFTNYRFYEIDINYLKYLNSIDSEVYYNSSYLYYCKPFIGIIVGINKYNYFIPLTSAKEKHKNWKNIADEHLLIYEIVNKNKKIIKEFLKVCAIGTYFFIFISLSNLLVYTLMYLIKSIAKIKYKLQ